MYIRYNLYHFINKNVNVLFAQYLMKSRHLLCIFFNFSFVNDDLVWATLIFFYIYHIACKFYKFSILWYKISSKKVLRTKKTQKWIKVRSYCVGSSREDWWFKELCKDWTSYWYQSMEFLAFDSRPDLLSMLRMSAGEVLLFEHSKNEAKSRNIIAAYCEIKFCGKNIFFQSIWITFTTIFRYRM